MLAKGQRPTPRSTLTSTTLRSLASTELVAVHALPPHLIIEGVLGQGGNSVVYEARHARLNVPVAIKVLGRSAKQGEEARIRLLREAELYARLSDPRFPRVYDVDQLADGTPYMVMELIEGHTLAEYLRAGPLPPHSALAIVREVLLALTDLHRVGVVHRDIKPSNIMLEHHGNAVRMRLVDLGIAKSTGQEVSPLTNQGSIVGTPYYLSPEQITGQPLDARSDLYALGVVLYEMLSGRHPFKGRTVGAILAATLRDKPQGLEGISTDISPELRKFVATAMARDPSDRFPSARHMLRALQGLRGKPAKGSASSLRGQLRVTSCPSLSRAIEVPAVTPANSSSLT